MIEQYVSPAEIRRLVSTLLVTVGAIAIFALFGFIVVPGLRNANKPATAPPVAAPQGEAGWLDPTDYPPARGYETGAIDPKTLLAAGPELLERGKELFQQNCVACHGAAGQGDGPAATGLNPPPKDFTQAAGWKNGSQLTAIYKTLRQGVPGTAMVSYSYLGAKDSMALAHFVQSLGGFAHPSDDATARDALAEELSSGGDSVPNRIPVSMAIDKLVSEYVAAKPLKLRATAAGAEGATLLARVVIDPSRAGQALAQSPSWYVSASSLAAAIVPEVPGNGFAVSVATLSPEEWQVLHRALLVATGTADYPEGTS